MNKVLQYIIVVLIAATLVGCGLFSKNKGVIGKASIAEDKAAAKITNVDTKAAAVNVERLDKVGLFSTGVALSLQKETNQTPAIKVATSLNERVIALANRPDFEEAKEIAKLVDQMITNKVVGDKMLAKKDSEIEELGIVIKQLGVQKERVVKDYMNLADKNAHLQDQYVQTIDDMDSWGGLGAIWYGFKQLLTRLAWILGIGGIAFIVLRVLSISNPIAAGIFSIFNVIGSWFVHIIQIVVPKAVNLAGNVSSALFNAYKSTLVKIVDAIQMAKETAAKTGKPVNIEDVLTEVAKSMNDDEKAIVDELKKALNWK